MSQQRKKWLLTLLAIAATLCLALGVALSQVADAPGPLEAKHNVVLPEGTGILKIGQLMANEGVVRSRFLFPFYYILLEYHRPLKAGEYEFAAGASYRQVLATLGSGITVVRKITIPEGITASQALLLLSENETLKGEIPSTIAEGSLLPETYYYSYGDDRGWLLSRMRESQKEILDKHWEKRAPDLPFSTREEAITLASIVEKETGVASERGRVAAVYVNRLRKGMKLQADPTVIYGILQGKPALGRPITREDLTTDTPYNSYTRYGLPPGPIALPGKDSILAVLNPPTTRDVFFVADGKGGHVFSETLDQHNKNVGRYRAIISGKAAPKEVKKPAVKEPAAPAEKKPEEPSKPAGEAPKDTAPTPAPEGAKGESPASGSTDGGTSILDIF